LGGNNLNKTQYKYRLLPDDCCAIVIGKLNEPGIVVVLNT
jgi:hypothetical protein